MNPYYDDPAAVAAWHGDRSGRVNASEVAAILGLCPYNTALDIYLKKVDPQPHVEQQLPMSDPRVWGHLFEPALARAYEIDRNVTLIRVPPATHPQLACLSASADNLTESRDTVVELKKVGWRNSAEWGEAGSDVLPERILVQVQTQMACYDIPVCDVVGLIGETDFRVMRVERDAKVCEIIADVVADFWRSVEDRDPPEPDWSHSATPDVIKRLHRPSASESITFDDSLLSELQTFTQAKQQIAHYEGIAKQAKARVEHAMGTASLGVLGNWKVTRREQLTRGYTVADRTSIVTTIRAPKECK